MFCALCVISVDGQKFGIFNVAENAALHFLTAILVGIRGFVLHPLRNRFRGFFT